MTLGFAVETIKMARRASNYIQCNSAAGITPFPTRHEFGFSRHDEAPATAQRLGESSLARVTSCPPRRLAWQARPITGSTSKIGCAYPPDRNSLGRPSVGIWRLRATFHAI